MEPEAKYTLVGTAVIALLALLAAAVVWLRGAGEEVGDRRYKIYFERQSLEGLQQRSDVKMQGIRVGTVTAFRISSWRPGAVEVFVRVDGTTPVRKSAQAVVERHLITGIASIRLFNLTEDSPLLTEVPSGEVYPVIAEGESEIQIFSESMSQLAQRAGETLHRINSTLSLQNQAVLTEVLQNLQSLSANADRTLPALERTLASLERTLAGLERTLASVGGAADEVRALSKGVGEDARRLASRYDALGEESGAAVREIAAAVRQMSADVTRISQRVDALLASGDTELRVTAQELRATADSLGAVARRFGDPRSILYGPPQGGLGPGEGAR